MNIFNYESHDVLGTVESVDTATVVIRVENDNRLRDLQINHLVAIQSSKIGQHLIGIVSKIVRKSAQTELDFEVFLISRLSRVVLRPAVTRKSVGEMTSPFAA